MAFDISNDQPPPRFTPPPEQLSAERIRRPRALDPADLKPGTVVLWHNAVITYQHASRHRVLAEPAGGWVRMVNLGFLDEPDSPAWLADMGMAPYEDGMWRAACWVTDVFPEVP